MQGLQYWGCFKEGLIKHGSVIPHSMKGQVIYIWEDGYCSTSQVISKG